MNDCIQKIAIQMDDFGARLKMERKRLGMTQEAFAEACNVAKGSQLNYELGKRLPDSEYLCLAGRLGANIHYLLFGQVFGDHLTVEERELLRRYRAQSGHGKTAMQFLLVGMIDAKIEPQGLSEAAKRELRILEAFRDIPESRQLEIELMLCKNDDSPTP